MQGGGSMAQRTLLTICLGSSGVLKVNCKPTTVSEQIECARLTKLISLPLRLIDEVIRESRSTEVSQ